MKMLIGGTWQAAATGRTEDVTSPFGYINAGQVCISVQRVITHPAVAADFLRWPR